MKRADLKVGERYVLLSPSQRNKSSFHYIRKDVVMVVDTTPTYAENRPSGWSRRERDSGFIIVNGVRHEYADDWSVRIDTDQERWRYRKGEVSRGVLVLHYDKVYAHAAEPLPVLDVVPIAQVAMTEAEFDAEVKVQKEQRRTEQEASERAGRVRAQRIAAFNDIMLTKGITARLSPYRNEVTLTYDEFEALLERVEA